MRFTFMNSPFATAGAIFAGGLLVSLAAAADVVGTVPGQFSVDPSGAANYKIDIQVPPGVHGMQPSLALLYSSRAGNSDLGVGWSLSGLSMISRCGQTLEDDGQWLPPSLQATDRFCMDGQRLVPSAAGSNEYRTKFATTQRIVASGVAGNGPASFTVYDKTAMTRSYGTTTSELGSDGKTVLMWPINKIADPLGNYISFTYASTGVKSAKEYILTEIDYGNANGVQVGRVVFNYDIGSRTDDEYRFTAKTGISTINLLKSIQVYGPNGQFIRQYNLGYQLSVRTGRNLLQTVSQCDPSGSCLPPTTFTWPNSNFAAGSTSAAKGTTGLGGPDDTVGVATNQPGSWKSLDLDGDGLADYVYIASDNYVHVILGKDLKTDIKTNIPGLGNVMRLNWGTVADFYGNGQQELLTPHVSMSSSGCSATPDLYWLLAWQNGQLVIDGNYTLEGPIGTYNGVPNEYQGNIPVAIDMDGKGLPSLFTKNASCNSGNPETLWYWHNNGHGWDAPIQTTYTFGDGDNAIVPINFTGKGYGEFYIGHCTASVCQPGGIYTANINLAQGTLTLQKIGSDFFNFSMNGPTFLDTNGDGLTDAVVPTNGQWCFFLNTGGAWSPDPTSSPSPLCVNADTRQMGQAFALDWFGNGHQDLMVLQQDSSGAQYYWAIGLHPVSGAPLAPVNTGIYYDGNVNDMFTDVNGDGQPDYVTVAYGGTSLNIYYNNNSFPELIGQIQTTNAANQSLGSTTVVHYLPLPLANASGWTTGAGPAPDAGAAPQYRKYMAPLPLVVDYLIDSGLGSGSSTQWLYTYHRYGGPMADAWGRGFLGFSDLQTINENLGIMTESTMSQGLLTAGMVLSTAQYQIPSVELSPIYGTLSSPSTVTVPTCQWVYILSIAHLQCSYVGNAGVQGFPALTGLQLLTQTQNTGLTTLSLSQGGTFSYFKTSTATTYDLGTGAQYKQVITQPTYVIDPSGNNPQTTDVNVETKTSSGDDYTVDTNNIQYQSYAPGGIWCMLGRVTSSTVQDIWNAAGSSPIQTSTPKSPAHTATFSYSPACMVSEEDSAVLAPSGSVLSTLKKTYGFDGFGNITSATISGVNPDSSAFPTRTASTQYDYFGLYPVSSSNALGQAALSTWDYRFGLKASGTDPNGLTVSTTYDSFGRQLHAQGVMPAQQSAWSYNWCGSGVSCTLSNSVYAYTEFVNSETSPGTMIPSAITEYDRLGRPVLSVHYGLYGKPDYQATSYDIMSRANYVSQPYQTGDTICWDYKTYDLLSRVTQDYQAKKATECGGAVTSYTRTTSYNYSGLTTTATRGSETSTTTLNALGKVATFKDANGKTTEYAYDFWGNTAEVLDATGQNKTLITSDSAGDKLSMTDPDMGTWPSYVYDAGGELTSQTDARGNTVTMQYDLLGRMTQRNELEGQSNWKYDVGYGAGIGKLGYETGPNGYWAGYAYDGYGNATDKITVIGGQEFWVTNTYDSFGNVSQVLYPSLTGINMSGTPATPAGLSVTQCTGSVSPNPTCAVTYVSWTLAQNGQMYHLFRTPSGVSAPSSAYEVYSGPDANFFDAGITANGTYTWWLQACNDQLCSGYASASATITLPPEVPQPPSVPVSDSHQQSIPVSWLPVPMLDSTSPGPVSYKLLESTDGVNYNRVYWNTATSTSAPLTVDGTYYFEVRSCTSNNYCSQLGQPSVGYTTYLQPSAPQSPSAPASVTPTTSPATYSVSWTASAFQPSSGTTYILQERNVTQNGAFATIYQGPNLSYPLSKTQDGIYAYQVEACNSRSLGVCSAFVTTSNVAVTLPPTSPGVPTIPAYDQHSSTWQISWTPSALTSGSTAPISYYVVQYWSGASGFTNVTGTQTLSGGLMYATATAVLPGRYYGNGTYTYAVQACTTDTAVSNTAACTLFTPVSSSYTTTIAPGVLTNISVPSQSNWDGSFSVTYTWPATGTGGPATSVTGEVYDLACTDPPNAKCTTVSEARCSSTTTTCTFAANSLPAGNNYSLQIRAEDNGVPGPWVQELEPNIVYLSPPAAPSIIGGSFSTAGSYTITWTTPATSTYYNLYESLGSGSYNQVQSSAANSYTSSIGRASTGQHYYVIACNQAGCGAASGVITVTYSSGGGTGCPPPPQICQLVLPDDYVTGIQTPDSVMPTDMWSNLSKTLQLPAMALPVSASADSSAAAPANASKPVFEPVQLAQSSGAETHVMQVADTSPVIQAAVTPLLAAPNMATRNNVPIPFAPMSAAPQVASLRAQPGPTTKPVDEGRSVPVQTISLADSGQVQWPPQAYDLKLSKYPPLRQDPRVAAHYQSQGGILPERVQRAATTDSAPPALMVGYSYDAYGHQVNVTRLDSNGNPLYNYWYAQAANARGEITQESLQLSTSNTSPGIGVTRQYDSATGLVTCINAVTGAGQASCTPGASGAGYIQSDSYAWDIYGNLTNRTSAVTGLNESAGYDPGNRLNNVTTQYNGTLVASDAPTYADQSGGTPGNLASHYGATYNYPAPGAITPHAVSSITLPGGTTRSFSYDADGNLLSESGDVNRTITWWSYNKPGTITQGGASENFFYGPNHDRYERVDHQPNNDTVTTFYVGGIFEAQSDSASGVTTYRNYIMAGTQMVAVDAFQGSSGSSATETVSYYFHDQLGEVEATSSGTGQNVAQYSYDAWGKSRSTTGANAFMVSAWGTCTPTLPGQHTGYGTHENLDDECLVHMEGRVYDPEIGRFVSADPTMQDPVSTQGYDRYGYIQNNPLSGIDPNGYHFHDIAGPVEGVLAAFGSDGCYWCEAGAVALAAIDGYQQTGSFKGAALDAGEAYAMYEVGTTFQGPYTIGQPQLWEKAALEATIGGAFSEAGGGNFGDGFLGAGVASVAGNYISLGDHTPLAIAEATAEQYILGGTVAEIGGGHFSDGASAAAFVELFNYGELSHWFGLTSQKLQNMAQTQEAADAKLKQESETVDAAKKVVAKDSAEFAKEYKSNATWLQKQIGPIETIHSIGEVAEHVGKELTVHAALKTAHSVAEVNQEVNTYVGNQAGAIFWRRIGMGTVGIEFTFEFGSMAPLVLGAALDVGDALYSGCVVATNGCHL